MGVTSVTPILIGEKMENSELLKKIEKAYSEPKSDEVYGIVKVEPYPGLTYPLSLFESLTIIRDEYQFSQADRDQLQRFRDNLVNAIPIDFVPNHPLFKILNPIMANVLFSIVSLEIALGAKPDFDIGEGSTFKFLIECIGSANKG